MIDINLKHILCPVDFSECSRQAFDQAWLSRAGTALTSPFSTSCRYPVRFRRCRTAPKAPAHSVSKRSLAAGRSRN